MNDFQTLYQQSSPLKQLQLMLSYTGIDGYCPPQSPEMPFEQLLIPFGPTQLQDLLEADEAGAPLSFIQIAFADELLQGLIQAAPLDPQHPAQTVELEQVILQLSVSFPLVVDEAQLPDMARLLGLLTQLSAVGGFGLTQNDHVFYRYAWCLPDKAIATPQSAWVIEMARQLNTAFYPILQSAARGEASLEQYGNQALLALSQLPSDSD